MPDTGQSLSRWLKAHRAFAFDGPLSARIVRRRALALIITFCWALPSMHSLAQAQPTTANREYTIKAAFLYHFLTYIDWPEGTFESPEQPFVIGVFREDPFGSVLDKIAQTKNVAGRPITILRMEKWEDILGCHILFVPESVGVQDENKLLSKLQGTHVVCVGESHDFLSRGGSAQFFLEGNKVRFDFNKDFVDRSALKISSKLLSLSKAAPSSTSTR